MREEFVGSYQQISPADVLAPYIECFWILEAPSQLSRGSERLPADGRVEVMFYLAGPSIRYRADGYGEPHVQARSAILGGRSRGYIIEQTGASHYVAIRFRPGGIAPFIKIPLTELIDQVVDLNLVWGHVVQTLEMQLYEADSPEHILAILQNALLKRFEALPFLPGIQAAIAKIDASGGCISIANLAAESGWSLKHFERLFAQYTGFMPKQYARIARFRLISNWTTLHPRQKKIGQLATEFGYFDQSHLVKEFIAFTGVAPRTFFASENRILEMAIQNLAPGIFLSDFYKTEAE